MKIYKCERKKSNLLKKIDFVKLFVITIFLLIILFLFFYLLGQFKDINTAIITSIIITCLIDFELVLNDIIENRKRIFLVNKSKISYIEIHDGKDGKFLSDKEFDEMIKNIDLENILINQEKFEGIDHGEIIKVNKVINRMNKIIIKAEVKSREWKSKGKFTISSLKLLEKNYNKKIIIPKDYNNFEELLELILKKNN